MIWLTLTLTPQAEGVQQERDELFQRFEVAVRDVEQRSVFREIVLEKKVQALSSELEGRDAQLGEVLSAANLDPSVLGSIQSRIDGILQGKNREMREVRFELARVAKLYNTLADTVTRKMGEYGVHDAELDGFQPIRVSNPHELAENV
ncbi:growth arrest-specific protein 8 [Kipferlia bialata]|uniref:Growth arrest-specific protein 8 n=1 Tax=Kipferlia bialata TaxID=797122 RepID=A0A9K3GMU0_9EUKA|nr:growth arrest-specific protein 8 [Kipferlia bialata]|eukprot:g12152.t1